MDFLLSPGNAIISNLFARYLQGIWRRTAQRRGERVVNPLHGQKSSMAMVKIPTLNGSLSCRRRWPWSALSRLGETGEFGGGDSLVPPVLLAAADGRTDVDRLIPRIREAIGDR